MGCNRFCFYLVYVSFAPLTAYEFYRPRGLTVVGKSYLWATRAGGGRRRLCPPGVRVAAVVIVVIDTRADVVDARTAPRTGGGRVRAPVERTRIVIRVGLTVKFARGRGPITAVIFFVIVLPVRVIVGCVTAAAAAATVTAPVPVIAAVRRFRMVERFGRAVMRRIVRGGRRRHVIVIVLVIIRWRVPVTAVAVAVAAAAAVVRRLELVHEVADLVHQTGVGRHVQVHPGLDDFLAELVFADLQRQQRVDADQAQVQPVTAPQGMPVRVHRRVRPVRTYGIRTAAAAAGR